jgi:hypothetical protein
MLPQPSRAQRTWRGRLASGRISISAELAAHQSVTWIYVHESMHLALMQRTQFGQLQLALDAFAGRRFPPGLVQTCARELLGQLFAASNVTHETAATYLADRGSAGEPRPEGYLDAPSTRCLSSLDGLPDRPASQLCMIAAQRALSTAIIDDWTEHRLATAGRLAKYLSDDTANPDLRWRHITSRLDQLNAALVVPDLTAYLSTVEPTTPAADDATLQRLIEALPGQLLDGADMSESEAAATSVIVSRRELEIPFSAIPPLITMPDKTTGRPFAVVPEADWTEIVSGSELLLVTANTASVAAPVQETLGGGTRALHPGDVDVVGHSSSMDSLMSMSIGALASVLRDAPEELTVCIRGGPYAAGLRDQAIEDALGSRRHVILMPIAGIDLVYSSIRAGIGEAEGMSYFLVRHNLDGDLAYAVLYPTAAKEPVAIMPGLVVTLDEVGSRIETSMWGRPVKLGRLRALSGAMVGDMERVMTWFAGEPPLISSEETVSGP